MTNLSKPGVGRIEVPGSRGIRSAKQLATELEELRGRLDEAEETLRAIRAGEVDALVVSTAEGERIFTLQGADRSYRALLEQMNEGALSLTSEGMILFANQQFAAMLKAPLEKVIGSNLHGWIAPESRRTLEAFLREGTKYKCRQELSLAARDGTTVPVSLSANPVSLDGSGHTLGVVAADLSKQKIAEQSLRLSEAKFRKVFENSQLGKCLQSMEGEVEFNKAFCEMVGYTAEELQSKTWKEITHPDDIAETEDALARLLEGTITSARFEKRYIHKAGSVVWAQVTIDVGRDSAGEPLYILTAVSDITARKRADAAVLDLKQHLERNIEMERLRLAQDVHDVPLQELYGVIYKLEEMRPKLLPENVRTVDGVISDVQKTLNSLRAIASELRPPALSRFGLEKAVRSYIEDFLERNPQIEVKAALANDRQLLPETVRLALFRVLQESFANIVRHAEATQIEVRFSFDAEQAELEISDNGKGFSVPESWLEMVRDGHYGLAGMAERLDAAGGRLEVESLPGKGSTLRAIVPYAGHE